MVGLPCGRLRKTSLHINGTRTLVRACSNIYLDDTEFEKLNAKVILERMKILVLIGGDSFTLQKGYTIFWKPGNCPPRPP